MTNAEKALLASYTALVESPPCGGPCDCGICRVRAHALDRIAVALTEAGYTERRVYGGSRWGLS